MGNEAAERTEEATPRRRQKEREKGNVSKSRDMDWTHGNFCKIYGRIHPKPDA